MLELMTPDTSLHTAWLEAHTEWGPGLHEDGFGVREGDDLSDESVFCGWVDWLNSRAAHMWWIVDERVVLGGICLRQEATRDGVVIGHIGYGVRPSARGRGVASWALREVIKRARTDGMPGCLVICRDENLASQRTIEKCGGVLRERTVDPRGAAMRYWIET